VGRNSRRAAATPVTPPPALLALASLAFDADADIEEIAEQLGHSNSRITRALYVDRLEGRRRNAADFMDVLAARR
jgi:integrase